MFRISILEISLVCILVLLVVSVPILITMLGARIQRRLDEIEKRISSKEEG